jgi:hypothetical protein
MAVERATFEIKRRRIEPMAMGRRPPFSLINGTREADDSREAQVRGSFP